MKQKKSMDVYKHGEAIKRRDKMKKIILFSLIFLFSVSLFGCTGNGHEANPEKEGQSQEIPQQTDESEQETVASLVEDFGQKLKNVYLTAPKEIVQKDVEENYGLYISPELLQKWLNDPFTVPGRHTSSPWPDHIEIFSLEKLSDNEYKVKGKIIEITSVEMVNGGAAAERPITLLVEKVETLWLITDVELGDYEKSHIEVYRNPQYGFNFTLPNTWKGYSIITDNWKGSSFEETEDDKKVETGPMILIRHPQWTTQDQRQDIPIMIFTIFQWNALQQGEFHIGAAPVNPSELGRNSKYVFALPARYNFAFPNGYEEVEEILKTNPLEADENFTVS